LGRLKPVSKGNFGNGPGEYYKIEEVSVIIGFISPISCKFCSLCNRLRLTANGLLIPCLSNEVWLDLKTPLRANKERETLHLLKKAIFLKPLGHNFQFSSTQEYLMSQIGG